MLLRSFLVAVLAGAVLVAVGFSVNSLSSEHQPSAMLLASPSQAAAASAPVEVGGQINIARVVKPHGGERGAGIAEQAHRYLGLAAYRSRGTIPVLALILALLNILYLARPHGGDAGPRWVLRRGWSRPRAEAVEIDGDLTECGGLPVRDVGEGLSDHGAEDDDRVDRSK